MNTAVSPSPSLPADGSVRDVAQGHWCGILPSLGIDAHFLTGRHGPCPLCGGRDRFRFDDKEGRGTYFCSGCGAGDGVQLALKFTGWDFHELAKRIESLAGTVPRPPSRQEYSDPQKLDTLRRIWGEAHPIAEGDASTGYLRMRGLLLPRMPSSIRTHPTLIYHEDGGHPAGTYAAMLAGITNAMGLPVGIHRTYLLNARKAPVSSPKKLLPGLGLSGAAIRLTPICRRIGIAEGIETALAAMELHRMPVWSCVSDSGLASFEPPVGVEEVVVFGDHDEVSFAGEAAAYAAAKRLHTKGLKIEVKIPSIPGDWLDVLAAGATT